MKKLVIASAAATLLSLGALVVPATASAGVAVSVQFGPPAPPVVERVPAPRPGYVWAPGHYEYRHGRYAWTGGRWIGARPGYAYNAPSWVERRGRWYYSDARWDRDRHGMANRYDRHPNRADAVRYDRDRDGVPNAHDRRPNDPHRR